jgi:hypothetical protein
MRQGQRISTIVAAGVVGLLLWLALGTSPTRAQDVPLSKEVAENVQQGDVTAAEIETVTLMDQPADAAKTAAALNELQSSIIGWSQVLTVVFGAMLTMAGGVVALVMRWRNVTSDARVTQTLERLLGERKNLT